MPPPTAVTGITSLTPAKAAGSTRIGAYPTPGSRLPALLRRLLASLLIASARAGKCRAHQFARHTAAVGTVIPWTSIDLLDGVQVRAISAGGDPVHVEVQRRSRYRGSCSARRRRAGRLDRSAPATVPVSRRPRRAAVIVRVDEMIAWSRFFRFRQNHSIWSAYMFGVANTSPVPFPVDSRMIFFRWSVGGCHTSMTAL